MEGHEDTDVCRMPWLFSNLYALEITLNSRQSCQPGVSWTRNNTVPDYIVSYFLVKDKVGNGRESCL